MGPNTPAVSPQSRLSIRFLTVNPEIALERSAIPEIPIKELVASYAVTSQITTNGELRRRHKISGLHEFAVSLQADVNKAAGAFLLYGHVTEEYLFAEEEMLIK
jgi:hypothetical protein